MIRRGGLLPEEAPRFSAYLDDDLLSYAYALMSTSLELLDAIDTPNIAETDSSTVAAWGQVARTALIQASFAIEAATRNAVPAEALAFHRLIAGAASHLGGYAARAFSLVQASIDSGRLTPMEDTLADLILRDLDRIEERTLRLRSSDDLTDDALLEALEADGESVGDPVDLTAESGHHGVGPVALLLSEHYLSAVSSALFAIAYNRLTALRGALEEIEVGEQASAQVSAAGPWWVYRLTRRLLGDLGETSISANIPSSRPPAATPTAGMPGEGPRSWSYLRRTFVASLFARRRSEIDLWPSQLNVVGRIFNDAQDLVVALPTSAGKTRIAELCILACLAQGRRTVYVTPLRALSAQTEQILGRTFAPLGARVSSLYGSMGVSDVDEDALRSSQIVITTPEKLDFALRSDPSILDDVGLVVLDEGHMIGPSEREVRYEAQIQRLLRRADSESRRIVCLSAVFPSGAELDDFVAWITDDEAGGLHREDWRPTLQRFGLVEWRGDHARLTMTLGDDQPFIPRYLEAKEPSGRRKKMFPSDTRELIIATAWRLVEEGQTVLIFCPQRNSVEPYAREIIKLRRQGLIDSVLPSEVDLEEALVVGAEWFGTDHPILGCLKLGVAIHHGALPGPFRREVERLLHLSVIKVTVASPTLAQGLNLSASVVLFHGLRRGRELLTGSEFANVIGRAGRAFVDTEGLVLYPLFEPSSRRRAEWLSLTVGEAGKTLQSGLIAVGVALIRRMLASRGSQHLPSFINYLTGGADWAFPVIPGEDPAVTRDAELSWHSNLMLLDTGILSIAGDDDSDPDEVTQLVTDVLRDSLWDRQLRRIEQQAAATLLRELVNGRARFVWAISSAAQRRGWYRAGLGADSGSELGAVAADLVGAIDLAEVAIANNDTNTATERIHAIAAVLFRISQFRPEISLDSWQDVLAHWLSGRPLNELEEDPLRVAQFIESDLIYRLVWGMEAARVYELAQGNPTAEALTGSVVTAIETGTFNLAAAILIRSGFDHRGAAIIAVTSTGADYETATGMREWIRGLDPDVTSSESWPTADSHAAWNDFTHRSGQASRARWRRRIKEVEDVIWYGAVPDADAWLRVTYAGTRKVHLWSPGYDLLGEAAIDISATRLGVLHARRLPDNPGVELNYRGPADLLAADD
jgi:superfamily II DNA/RNA helicase